MGLVAAHHRVVDGFEEVAQHGLFGGVVGDLGHDQFVFANFVSDGVGIVHQILVGELTGDLLSSGNLHGSLHSSLLGTCAVDCHPRTECARLATQNGDPGISALYKTAMTYLISVNDEIERQQVAHPTASRFVSLFWLTDTDDVYWLVYPGSSFQSGRGSTPDAKIITESWAMAVLKMRHDFRCRH